LLFTYGEQILTCRWRQPLGWNIWPQDVVVWPRPLNQTISDSPSTWNSSKRCGIS